ncbi:MAG TPA: RNA polymerase sigma-70 factor [Cyclobacteriaceae bacterium]|nr:RNA polymerase sigma-70 factor [Cyclobacteriaceae bacterium]
MINTEQNTEQDILGKLHAGDKTAFEMVFRTYYNTLCNYAYGFVSDQDEAEEVVQSTFINFWEKRNDINIQHSLKAYLYRSVRNTCLNIIKHEKVKNKHQEYAMTYSSLASESTAQAVMKNELEQKIAEAMTKLPEQCRLVFSLSRFEDLKYQEIATQLGISVKTVENQMGKALRIMREQLKDYLPLLLIFFEGWFS